MKYHELVDYDWQPKLIGDRTAPWLERFPSFGMILFHPTQLYSFIPIPRCGSQFFCHFLAEKHNWTGNHVDNYQNFCEALGRWKEEYKRKPKYFTIVRDPLERYISGLWVLYDAKKQTIKDHRMDKPQLDQLFLNPSLNDHHTINQYNFFYNIDMQDVVFFNFNDKDLGQKIQHFFKSKLNIKFYAEEWINKDSEEKEVILKLLEDNPQYMEKIKTYLEDDYKFLSAIKYYEPN
jgi:hypothetical protein